METISVPIFVESRYRVDRKRIKKAVVSILSEQGIARTCEISIAIVGNRKMRQLNKKYRNLDKVTNVLSFPQTEGEHMKTPEDILYLGDMVLCYPYVVQEAAKDDVLVDEKIDELVKHSTLHLMGIHH